MSLFDNLFKSAATKKAELMAEIKEEIAEEKRKEEEAAVEAQKAEEKRVEELKEAARSLNEDKMESDEPWVEMIGSSVDPEKGLKVELAWNPAFINYLREGGIQGASEEECAQRWLAMVARDVDGRYADDDNDGKENSEYQ